MLIVDRWPIIPIHLMDDYHDQSNWHYDFLTPQNLNQADLRDDDPERIEAEMAISPPHRFKINFLFVEKTERFRAEILDGNLGSYAVV